MPPTGPYQFDACTPPYAYGWWRWLEAARENYGGGQHHPVWYALASGIQCRNDWWSSIEFWQIYCNIFGCSRSQDPGVHHEYDSLSPRTPAVVEQALYNTWVANGSGPAWTNWGFLVWHGPPAPAFHAWMVNYKDYDGTSIQPRAIDMATNAVQIGRPFIFPKGPVVGPVLGCNFSLDCYISDLYPTCSMHLA